MFMVMFLLGLIGLSTGAIRFFSCWIVEGIKGDRFSTHRTMVWRNVWTHFGVTFLFFYLAFHM